MTWDDKLLWNKNGVIYDSGTLHIWGKESVFMALILNASLSNTKLADQRMESGCLHIYYNHKFLMNKYVKDMGL